MVRIIKPSYENATNIHDRTKQKKNLHSEWAAVHLVQELAHLAGDLDALVELHQRTVIAILRRDLVGPAGREMPQRFHSGLRDSVECLCLDRSLAVVVAAAVAEQVCFEGYDGSADLPHYEEGHQMRFQDHLELQEDQKGVEEGRRRGLLEDHWGYGLRSVIAMQQADGSGCYWCCFGEEAEAGIVRDAVSLFPVSHCVLVHDAQDLLVVAMHVAGAVAPQAHVPAPGRSPAGRAIGCSS
jgi:hypothetical protein